MLMHKIFPEIRPTSKFDRQSQQLLETAIEALFNSFDTNKTGRLSYKNLNVGFDLLCAAEDG